MTERKLGPNVKRLMIEKMALLAVPPGGGFESGLRALTEPGLLAKHAKIAMTWVWASIDAVKAAHDNPYGQDDEKIAEVILEGIAARKAEQAKLRK